jgi:hypothetical protein
LKSWPWSYGSWIYNYLCNQCLPPLMMWVRISIRARCATLCDEVCQWLAIGLWFSPGPPVSFSNKTDCHNITEIMLKVALNTIEQTNILFEVFKVMYNKCYKIVVVHVFAWLRFSKRMMVEMLMYIIRCVQ